MVYYGPKNIPILPDMDVACCLKTLQFNTSLSSYVTLNRVSEYSHVQILLSNSQIGT